MATDVAAAERSTRRRRSSSRSAASAITRARVHRRRRAAVVAVAALRLALLSPREGTDDAQVSGHVSPVATRVGGTVLAIKVTDNQSVKAGDVLVELDPRDYQLAVAKAEADLAAAEAAARAATATCRSTSSSARSGQQVAQVATGNADAGLHRGDARDRGVARQGRRRRRRGSSRRGRARHAPTQDLARLAPLAAKDEIPRQQLDTATADKQAADAAVASAEAAVREATRQPRGRRVARARRPRAWCSSPGRRRRRPRRLRSRSRSSKRGRPAPMRK